MEFAANLSMMFQEWDFLDRFNAATDAGFRAVEYLFPYDHTPDQIGKALRKSGLKQALFNLPPGDWAAGERGIAALPDRSDEFRQSVRTALAYAEATGVERLHMMAGHALASDPIAMRCYLTNLAHAADEAARCGASILIEPINGRDMPGYFLNDFGLAARIIDEVRRPNVRLQYDIYHRQILHGDVLRSLEALFPIIGHVQVASVPARAEPGSGELDDARIFAKLAELGYAGFIGCEYRPAASTLGGLDWFYRSPFGRPKTGDQTHRPRSDLR